MLLISNKKNFKKIELLASKKRRQSCPDQAKGYFNTFHSQILIQISYFAPKISQMSNSAILVSEHLIECTNITWTEATLGKKMLGV